MTSIIITPRNKKELSALKHFIKALDLPYNESKEDISTNTITKEQFVEELLMSDDCNDFYLPREKQLLSLDFDFEEMKQEFENWLINNCDNE